VSPPALDTSDLSTSAGNNRTTVASAEPLVAQTASTAS
jgi:hypothetical protein